MTDQRVRDATELLVRDLGLEAAERELQQRVTDAAPDSPEQARAQAALSALRKGEVSE